MVSDDSNTILWWTKKEVAKRLRCSEQTVERRVRAGKLRAYQLEGGRQSLFRSDEVDALVVPA